MTPALHDHIRTWASGQAIPFTDQPLGTASERLWLLESGDLVGEIRVLQVRPDPPSFYLSVMRGSLVLDESWSDLQGLDVLLTAALRLLQQRVKTAVPLWHLQLGDLTP